MSTPEVPVLTDGVVTLRGLTADDAEAFAALHRDPEAVRWTSTDPDFSIEQAAALITVDVPASWSDGTLYRFAVADPATNRLLGTVSLHHVSRGAAEVGLKLSADARGSGTGTRAVNLIIDFAFEQLGLAVLHWYAMVGNWASRKLAYKCGFALEGTVRSLIPSGAGRTDCWILTLMRLDSREPKGDWDGPVLDLPTVVPELTDGVVRLRALRTSDADRLADQCRDEATLRWTAVPAGYSLKDALGYIRRTVPHGWRTGTEQVFAIADGASDELIGTIGLHAIRPGTADVGIVVGPDRRGAGAGERAARLIIDYAFSQLNLQYLYWRALVPNWASRKLAWKLGFRFEAELRGFADNRGTPADLWLLSAATEEPRGPQKPWDGPDPVQS